MTTNLRTQIKNLLLMPLKPVQLIIAVTSVAALLSIFADSGHLDYLLSAMYGNQVAIRYALAATLVGYSLLNVYCCLSVAKTITAKLLRYLAAVMGVLIWSFCLTLELAIDNVVSTLLPIVPILAETWALAQLISKIREEDRRAQ